MCLILLVVQLFFSCKGWEHTHSDLKMVVVYDLSLGCYDLSLGCYDVSLGHYHLFYGCYDLSLENYDISLGDI